MQIVYETDDNAIVNTISSRINQELQDGKRVTWFVCGGSNIALIVQIMDQIDLTLTVNLTVLLTDERYGETGHPDSNWMQLDNAGFQAGQATIRRTLQPGLDMPATSAEYAFAVSEALIGANIVIAQFGIGSDGHIAGILPGTEASLIDAADDAAPLVLGYETDNFSRITITPPVWQFIHVAYACANGIGKRSQLQQLRDESLAVTQQPAQLLKMIPDATVYTDQQLDDA